MNSDIPRHNTVVIKPCVSFHDGKIPEEIFSRLVSTLAWIPMYFLNRTQRDPNAHPLDMYWYYPLVSVPDRYVDSAEPALADLQEDLGIVSTLWQVVRDLVNDPVRLYECEFTANAYGTEGHPHFDSARIDTRHGHITAIVYCNADWEIAWAGETVIFDASGEIDSAVLPKPGRICLIEGDPMHVARGVSRICPEPRRVLVFKMWRLGERCNESTPRSAAEPRDLS